MKIVHVEGVEVGGQRHRVILERDDGFLKDGSSLLINHTLYASSIHTHAISGIVGLASALASLAGTGVVDAIDTRVEGLEILTTAFPASSVSGILGISNGGTGTSTAFTSGSIVFAGAAGVYSQNATGLYWNNTTERLGVQTSSPSGLFSIKNKFYVDPTAANTASGIYMCINTDNVISTTGFKFLTLQSSGTERFRIDWSAGNAIRLYAPGRLDIESAGQIFYTGTQGFFQFHFSVNRTGDASSTATQKDSYGQYFQNSLWTGAASTQRFSQIRSKASTTNNLDHRLAFSLNVTGGVSTDGTEVMSLWWDDSDVMGRVGINNSAPSSRFHLSGSLGLKVSTSSASTLTLGDAAVYVFTGSASSVWSLPGVLANTDRLYFIKNRGSANLVLDPNSTEELYTTTNVSTLTVAAGEDKIIVSDGTYWNVIS